MRYYALPFLSFVLARAAETDGCGSVIAKSAISYLTPSTGYSVTCSSSTQTSFALKKHRHTFESLLETEKATDETTNVCFTASESTSDLAPYVQANLVASYVIRGIDLIDITSLSSGLTKPASVKLGAMPSSSDTPDLYASKSDLSSGMTWSNLAVNGHQDFDVDVSGQYLRLFPKIADSATSATGYSLGFILYGCEASLTALVSFEFKTSENAVIRQFAKLSVFIDKLTEFVCYIAGFTTSPASCPRILFADIEEDQLSVSTGGVGPSQLPIIRMKYRILPPGSNCVDCRPASVVQSKLAADLQDSSSKARSILTAVETWIEDPDPYACYNKVCADGTLCFNGVCVSAANLEAQAAAQIAVTKELKSGSSIDNELKKLTPLDVIADADQTSGILTFAKTPIAPGTVLTVNKETGQVAPQSADSAPVTTSSDSFLQRFLIPISVAGGVAVIILGLLGYKMYTRSLLAVDQRDRSV